MADKALMVACLKCEDVSPLLESDPGIVPADAAHHGEIVWCFPCEEWRRLVKDEGGSLVLTDLPADSVWHRVHGHPPLTAEQRALVTAIVRDVSP